MVITLSQWVESVEVRFSHLQKEVERMLQEIQAVQESAKAFIAEVNTDLANVLGAVKSLQDQIESIKSQGSVSAEDLKSLSDLASQLNAATTDAHSKTAAFAPASPATETQAASAEPVQADPAPATEAPAQEATPAPAPANE